MSLPRQAGVLMRRGMGSLRHQGCAHTEEAAEGHGRRRCLQVRRETWGVGTNPWTLILDFQPPSVTKTTSCV